MWQTLNDGGSKCDRNSLGFVAVFLHLASGMDFYYDPFKLCEVLLLSVGQWPHQKPTDYIPRRVVIVSVVVLFLLVQIRTLIVVNINMDEFSKNIQLLFVTFIGLLNLLTLYMKDNYGDLWSMMMSDYKSSTDKGESEIRENYTKQSGKMCLFYVVFLSTIIVLAAIATYMPVILDTLVPLNQTRTRELQFVLDLYIDIEEYFDVYAMYYSLSIAVGIWAFIANVSMISISIIHACAMFEALGYRLEHAFDVMADECSLAISGLDVDEAAYRNVAFCIESHHKAVKFANILEELMAPLCLQQILGMIVVLCFSLLIILESQLNFSTASFTVFGIIYICMIMCIGQMLINVSTDIRIKAYTSQWYLSSVQAQKLLVLVLRCCVPCSLSAYKLITFSLETAEMIVKTAVSYCMILRNLR